MSYSFDEYAKMLADPVRGAAYLRAVRETVRPGAVVADIGAGPGVLGVYAATLGARRVYLIDPDASVYAGAALAQENGVGDRVQVIRAPSTEVELPELADVIVSDLRGVMPLHGRHLSAAADMRRRLLAPGGVCVPRRDVLMTALVEDGALYARTVGAWSALPVPLAVDSLSRLLANRWYHARAAGAQLLTQPSHFVTLDYDQPSPPLGAQWEAVATRDGVAHGLLLWFDAELTPTIAFSNAPSAPAALYGQAFFPFAPALELRRDQRVRMDVRAALGGDDYSWSWTASTDDGRAVRHSTLHGIPLDGAALAKRSERYVPTRSTEADVIFAVLGAVDSRASLGDLARMLCSRFGGRFPTPESALHFVSQLEDYWAR
ncbi:MAG: Methyltransferase type 12 [Gemmatimonadetes bacterium]|nr:Methyltransferase type 12 [Gemmatimonadota bacterium]